MDIGFIGLGHMGSGIAARLLKPGRRLTVWNRSPEPVARLVAQGAQAAATPAQALDADIAFSMLANDEAIEATLLQSGALDQARQGLVHVNLATVSVALARRMDELHQARGLGYVAAPVLGRPDVAAAGELNVLLAGAPAATARARPLIEDFAHAVWPLGDDPVRANVVKLASNFALASAIETLGEAGALVAAYGVAPADLYEIMTGTAFAAPAYKTYADIIAHARFTPAGIRPAARLQGRASGAAGGRGPQHPPAGRIPAARPLRRSPRHRRRRQGLVRPSRRRLPKEWTNPGGSVGG